MTAMTAIRPVGGGTGHAAESAARSHWWSTAAIVVGLVLAAAAGMWLAARITLRPAPDPRVAALQTQVNDLSVRVAERPAGPRGVPGPAGRAGRDAPTALVAAEVSRQVAAYLRAHPPQTAADVTAAVAAYLGAHPPAQGRPGAPPASWTFTVAGVTQVCTKIPAAPAGEPRYTCQPVH